MSVDVVAIITSDVVGLDWSQKGRQSLREAHEELISMLEIPDVAHVEIIDPIWDPIPRPDSSIEEEVRANLKKLSNADIVFLYNPNGVIDPDVAILLVTVGNSFILHGWQTPIYSLNKIIGGYYLDLHYEEIDLGVLRSQLMRENHELTRS